MKVLIKSSGGTEQTLCHGNATGVDKHVGPSQLSVVSAQANEVAERIRAVYTKPLDRFNRAVRLSFQVTRECASALAAELFCFTHPRDSIRSGTVYILAESATGGTDQLTLSDAHLDSIECRHVGLTVIVTYSIIGGTIA